MLTTLRLTSNVFMNERRKSVSLATPPSPSTAFSDYVISQKGSPLLDRGKPTMPVRHIVSTCRSV